MPPSKGDEFLGNPFVFPPTWSPNQEEQVLSMPICAEGQIFFSKFPFNWDCSYSKFLLFIKVLIPFPVNPPLSLWAQRLYLLVFHECYTSSPQVSGWFSFPNLYSSSGNFPLLKTQLHSSVESFQDTFPSLLHKMEISHLPNWSNHMTCWYLTIFDL